MATLTGKTIAEFTEVTSAQSSDLILVSRSGASRKMTLDTLIGNLFKKTGDTADGNIRTRSTDINIATVPVENKSGSSFAMVDTNGNSLGSVYPARATDGSNRVIIRTNNLVGGETASNYFQLGVSASGDAFVLFSNPDAWKAALNIDKSSDNETANTISAASGITINEVRYRRFGSVAQVYISWKSASAITVPANGNVDDITVGTLVSGRRPWVASYGKSISSLGTYSIGVDGTVKFTYDTPTGAERTIAAGTNMGFVATYLLS